LELGAEREEVYSGFWGYNSLLTGAALGGNLLVLNGHTAIASMLAIVYTALLQFSIKAIFMKVIGVPSSGYFYYSLANTSDVCVPGAVTVPDAAVRDGNFVVSEAEQWQGGPDVPMAGIDLFSRETAL